eukprot:20712-Heterococcus_DN1.PRE.1
MSIWYSHSTAIQQLRASVAHACRVRVLVCVVLYWLQKRDFVDQRTGGSTVHVGKSSTRSAAVATTIAYCYFYWYTHPYCTPAGGIGALLLGHYSYSTAAATDAVVTGVAATAAVTSEAVTAAAAAAAASAAAAPKS